MICNSIPAGILAYSRVRALLEARVNRLRSLLEARVNRVRACYLWKFLRCELVIVVHYHEIWLKAETAASS